MFNPHYQPDINPITGAIKSNWDVSIFTYRLLHAIGTLSPNKFSNRVLIDRLRNPLKILQYHFTQYNELENKNNNPYNSNHTL